MGKIIMLKQKNNYAVPAVDGMLHIVEFLVSHNRMCGVTELSRELGLSTNLVFRIMKCLVERGYAQVDAGGLYQLNTGFYTLGMKLQSRFDLRSQAYHFLKELCKTIGETVQLQVPDGNRMLSMEVITPDNDYYLQVVPGSRLYYHANAFGKCIMAYMENAELDKLLAEDLPKFTPNTIISTDKIKEELENVRKTGFAYDRNEYLAGIYCIGSPVFDAGGKAIAGVGMTGLASRFNRTNISEFKKAVKQCAVDISKAIGYIGNMK
jgi:DNA-binding IclR family transcriptional regulator